MEIQGQRAVVRSRGAGSAAVHLRSPVGADFRSFLPTDDRHQPGPRDHAGRPRHHRWRRGQGPGRRSPRPRRGRNPGPSNWIQRSRKPTSTTKPRSSSGPAPTSAAACTSAEAVTTSALPSSACAAATSAWISWTSSSRCAARPSIGPRNLPGSWCPAIRTCSRPSRSPSATTCWASHRPWSGTTGESPPPIRTSTSIPWGRGPWRERPFPSTAI